ncbi:hypothetical protein AAFC00_002986 [Neodothiora populina]|uniref:Nucleotide-diphospho-sugar transferase n=1 Tax=Neodothiora populina TaxID=2781224 RepID=A0ABR3P8W1_9PEZI
MGFPYRLKRFIRTATIWHWITIIACTLVVYRFFTPKAQKAIAVPENETELNNEPDDGIDWSRFAYCQYVTDIEYLCNSLMMFESLHRLQSKADRLLLYPSQWELYPMKETWQSKFLHQAQKDYGVHIMPVRVQHFDDGEGTWAESFTKLLAFKQTQYDRVLSLDSDATILKPLDDLFLLPHAPVAAPHAYWIDNSSLSSAIMLIEPSMDEFKRVLGAMKNRTSDEFDMDIVNDLYAGNAMLLPNEHWVVSGEFRRKQHASYIGEGNLWDPDAVMNQVKFVHFSDWPFPKPWLPSEPAERKAMWPKCIPKTDGSEDCRNRNYWMWLYEDFKKRRKAVCSSVFTLYLD